MRDAPQHAARPSPLSRRRPCPMCLAVPAQVVLIGENRMAQVDIHGITRNVSLDLVPTADVGSW
ncbi:MAG TPA: HypC/HybG/HupF family hydrogenase formation chaperone, partial [Coriobacteriia bacterium]